MHQVHQPCPNAAGLSANDIQTYSGHMTSAMAEHYVKQYEWQVRKEETDSILDGYLETGHRGHRVQRGVQQNKNVNDAMHGLSLNSNAKEEVSNDDELFSVEEDSDDDLAGYSDVSALMSNAEEPAEDIPNEDEDSKVVEDMNREKCCKYKDEMMTIADMVESGAFDEEWKPQWETKQHDVSKISAPESMESENQIQFSHVAKEQGNQTLDGVRSGALRTIADMVESGAFDEEWKPQWETDSVFSRAKRTRKRNIETT
eukprot:226170_1